MILPEYTYRAVHGARTDVTCSLCGVSIGTYPYDNHDKGQLMVVGHTMQFHIKEQFEVLEERVQLLESLLTHGALEQEYEV